MRADSASLFKFSWCLLSARAISNSAESGVSRAELWLRWADKQVRPPAPPASILNLADGAERPGRLRRPDPAELIEAVRCAIIVIAVVHHQAGGRAVLGPALACAQLELHRNSGLHAARQFRRQRLRRL